MIMTDKELQLNLINNQSSVHNLAVSIIDTAVKHVGYPASNRVYMVIRSPLYDIIHDKVSVHVQRACGVKV